MDIVAYAAQKYSHNPALINELETLSFKDLEAATGRIATVLQRHGIRKGDIVTLCMPNSAAMVLVLLSLLRTGSVAAPLNYRFPGSRLQTLFPLLKSSALIGPQSLTDKLTHHAKLTPEEILAESNTHKQILSEKEPAQKQPAERFNDSKNQQLDSPPAQQLRKPVTVIHTSSSSGLPKAALHSFANHYYSALGSNENLPFGPGDIWLLSLPLFHIGGYAMLFRSLLGGGALVVPEPGTLIQDTLCRFHLSHLSLVPTQLYRLINDEKTLKKLQDFKVILLGGSTVEPALLEEASKAELPVYLTYGSTEMSSQITTTSGPVSTIGAGKVLPYRELSIDKESEILVKGPCLFQGYLSERGPMLKTDASGWFHTGDTGEMSPDGELLVTGRTDNMFISGGENIHPEEIERALCSFEGVRRAIVVPVDDPEYGFRPSAFIEVTGKALTDDEIKASLSSKTGKLKTPETITRIEQWRLLPGTEKIDRGYYKRMVDE